MLGDTLSDPMGVEEGGSMKGMGLLPIDTVFAGSKTRTQVTGQFLPKDEEAEPLCGVKLRGYEIHMGETTLKEGALPFTTIRDGVSGTEKQDGACSGNVYGTYVHGVFDCEEAAEALIRLIGRKKGIDVTDMTGVDFAAFKETQYDILAAELRKHLDMKKIYQILEEGI